MSDLTVVKYQTQQNAAFVDSYFEKSNSICVFLNEKRHRIVESSASSRLINYWEKEGLITADRSSQAGWRKYSIMDLVWVLLMGQLRKFGYPIESLKKLKANLTEKHPILETESFAYLEAYVAIVISQRIPVFINVMANGSYIMTSQKEKRSLEDHKVFAVNSHLTVSVNHLLSQVLKKDMYAQFFEGQLTKEEVKLLNEIRIGEYSEVVVHLKNKKMHRVDLVDYMDANENVQKILRQSEYVKIELTQADGKKKSLKRTTSKKL